MGIQNLTGQTLGQYELRELLGVGGMGAVYRGYQANLKRQVAVKVLSPELARQPGYLERFNREAETAAALEHRHIVPVHDYGMQQGVSYVVMRLLTGGTLADRLAQHTEEGKPLPSLGESADVLKQLASALDYAHSQGVIHRDIKASNVMFDNQGSAYLVDFGIAKLVEATQALTGSGVAMGTPLYMSPEQWKAEPITPAADQYALGVMAYALITGRPPFEAATPYALMHKHLHEPPTPPQTIRPDVPEEVADVLARALAKSPEDRFPTVTAFARAFEQAVSGYAGEATSFFVTPVRHKPAPHIPATPVSRPVPTSTTTLPFYRSPVAWVMAVIIVALLGVLAVTMLSSGSDDKGTPVAQVTGTPTLSRDQVLMQTATALSQELTAVASAQATFTLSPTETATPSPTMTSSPSETPSATPTSTPSLTAIPTETPPPTNTNTPVPTNTATSTPSPTPFPTPTATETPPPTATKVPTRTPTPIFPLEPYTNETLGLAFDVPVGWAEDIDEEIQNAGIRNVLFYANPDEVGSINDTPVDPVLLILRARAAAVDAEGAETPDDLLVLMFDVERDRVKPHTLESFPAARVVMTGGSATERSGVIYALRLGDDDWLIAVLLVDSDEKVPRLDEMIMLPIVESIEVIRPIE